MAPLSAMFYRRLLLILAVVFLALLFTVPDTILAYGDAGQVTSLTTSTCRRYVVKRGDTLVKIAARFGVSLDQLARANQVRDINLIFPGQRLCVPVKLPAAGSKVWEAPMAAIEIFSPVAEGLYHSPIEVIGLARKREAEVGLRLQQADGTVLAERRTTTDNDRHSFFRTTLRFETFSEETQAASLEIFEISAKDGAEINKVTIPLTLASGQRVLDVTQPEVGANVCSLVPISGYSFTFEGNVNLIAAKRDGSVIEEGFATGGGGDYEDWQETLGPLPAKERAVLISVLERSSADGSPIDQTRIPVTLLPKGSQDCP